MSNGMKVVLAMGVFMVITVIAIGGKLISTYNDFVSMEESIFAQYKQNQNNYDNYYKTVKEMIQVNDAYASDFKKVYDGLMQGRYGKNGSKAMFQWIQENMPNFDSSLYSKVQNAITAGRKDFETNQKTLLDKKRVYKQELRVIPNNLIAGLMGFPKVDLDEMDIVTSGETEEAFRTKKSQPIKLR